MSYAEDHEGDTRSTIRPGLDKGAAPRRRGGADRARRRVEHTESYSNKEGSGFLLRLLLGLVGVAILLVVQMFAFWPELRTAWNGILLEATAPKWQLYGILAGVLAGGALVIAIVASLQDRAGWRVWQLAVAWTALVVLVMQFVARQERPERAADDTLMRGVDMSIIALAPAVFAWQTEHSTLKAARAAHEAASSERDDLHKQAMAEQAELHQLELQKMKKDLDKEKELGSSMRTSVGQLEERATKLQQERDAALGQVTDLKQQIKAAESKVAMADQRGEQLQTELEQAKTQLAELQTIHEAVALELDLLRKQVGTPEPAAEPDAAPSVSSEAP